MFSDITCPHPKAPETQMITIALAIPPPTNPARANHNDSLSCPSRLPGRVRQRGSHHWCPESVFFGRVWGSYSGVDTHESPLLKTWRNRKSQLSTYHVEDNLLTVVGEFCLGDWAGIPFGVGGPAPCGVSTVFLLLGLVLRCYPDCVAPSLREFASWCCYIRIL